MEPSSAMRKRKVGWRNLSQLVFLAASIWSSCFLLTEGQYAFTIIPIEVQPPHSVEGHNVTLTPHFTAVPGVIVCTWFRERTDLDSKILTSFPNVDVQRPSSAFTNRETAGSNCSMTIRNLKSGDSNNYTVTVEGPYITAMGTVYMFVSEYLHTPHLESSVRSGFVAETANAILNCHTSNQPDVDVIWFKNARPLPFSAGSLSNRNRILTLSHVARDNTGQYSCMAKNFISQNESNQVLLRVAYGPEIKMNPEGTIYKNFNSDLLMECLVDSIPLAKLQWFVNGIEQKETGSLYKVTLKMTNNTVAYTCKATNSFNNRTEERTCIVKLKKGQMSYGVIAGIVVGAVAGVALIAGLLYFLSKTSFGATVPATHSSSLGSC